MAFNDTNVDRDVMIKDGKVIAYEVLTAVKIMKGDIVRLPAAGYALAGDGASSLAQFDCFGGIALETVDNTAGGSGAKKVRCLVEGSVPLLEASVNVTDSGTWAIASATLATTITSSAVTLCAVNGSDDANNIVNVGFITGIDWDDIIVGGAVSTTKLRVKLQALRQAYQ